MTKRVKLDEAEHLFLVDTVWIELDKEEKFQENHHLMMPRPWIPRLIALIEKHQANEDRLSGLMYLAHDLLQYGATKDEEIRSVYSDRWTKRQFPLLFSQLANDNTEMPKGPFLPHSKPYLGDESSTTTYLHRAFLWKNFFETYWHKGKDCDCEYDYDDEHKDYKVLVGKECDFHREFTLEELTIPSKDD